MIQNIYVPPKQRLYKSASRASSIKSNKHSDDSSSTSSTSDDEDSKMSIQKVDATGEPEINDANAILLAIIIVMMNDSKYLCSTKTKALHLNAHHFFPIFVFSFI
jgi:hypothetical protein